MASFTTSLVNTVGLVREVLVSLEEYLVSKRKSILRGVGCLVILR